LSYGRKEYRPEPVPPELPRRSPPMAVRAPDGALCDLGFDCTPAMPALNHVGDVPCLFSRIIMIELENDRIGFATINARVAAQIFQHVLG